MIDLQRVRPSCLSPGRGRRDGTAVSGQQDAGPVGAERPPREAHDDVERFGDARRGEQVLGSIDGPGGPRRGSD